MIKITTERTDRVWRAIVWDIDEETGARSCEAIAESETRKAAIAAARGDYRARAAFSEREMRRGYSNQRGRS